ncbi:MAG TPA: sugar phosphate nucleotidyltransferase [Anaerolineales bacterium]|nr:sugar phosphate nucleotidyltransferase [Anaerolineales bacterium]
MKTRAVIMAGGEGSRLSVLTAKRTKPAVPFAGKYRIIDFTLSNCVNSGVFDVMILAQYRPHSLIGHIGAGGPWDLNRDFTGGVRILTPYTNRSGADWFLGTADAVQQNFSFIKESGPDQLLILSGDHVYAMDYDALLTFHHDYQADLTMATIRVPEAEASRFGIVGVEKDYRVSSFIEKPARPSSNLVNMGVYVFNLETLDRALWEDHLNAASSHDFGKDIIPRIIAAGKRVFAFPFSGYWVDVGTYQSYWQAHMDLLADPPPLDLTDRKWVTHTRTEERPPMRIARNALVENSMICDGVIIEAGARIHNSVLSPGVVVRSGARVSQSVVLTDTVIGKDVHLSRAIIDKHVVLSDGARVGASSPKAELAVIGKNAWVPEGCLVKPGATIGTDVVAADYSGPVVKSGEILQTKRQPYEI